MSSTLVVHQRPTCPDRSSNRTPRTQICQNNPAVRTSRTNTESPAGCMDREREKNRKRGGDSSKGENSLIEGVARGGLWHAGLRTL